jgi:hypothetical protein
MDLGRGNASRAVLPPTVRVCRNIPHGETMCRELRTFEKHCNDNFITICGYHLSVFNKYNYYSTHPVWSPIRHSGVKGVPLVKQESTHLFHFNARRIRGKMRRDVLALLDLWQLATEAYSPQFM